MIYTSIAFGVSDAFKITCIEERGTGRYEPSSATGGLLPTQ